MREHGFSVKSFYFCEKLSMFPTIFGEPEEAQANSLCYKVATWVILHKEKFIYRNGITGNFEYEKIL